jgi:hypothetical protein
MEVGTPPAEGVGGERRPCIWFYGIGDFDWRCCFLVVPIWRYENLFQQQQQQHLDPSSI